MRIAFFSTQTYDMDFFNEANAEARHELRFLEPRLTPETASLAQGFAAVCAFVNDVIDDAVIASLSEGGTRVVALRSAGYNNVDLEAAAREGIVIVRVPAYSPYAVAEHTLGLILTLNRKIHRAYHRVRDGNFSLDGLLGFDMHGRTAGVVGTGRIGALVVRSLVALGCRVLVQDPIVNEDCVRMGATYVGLPELLAESDIVTLHCPLTPDSYHLIDASAVDRMKPGVMLINTGRGALVDTRALVEGLKSGKIGYLGLDVYEEERELFFRDLSAEVIQDDVFARLLTFPNVVITAHQGFFTRDALATIATTTLANLDDIEAGRPCPNEVRLDASR